ncbi:MAG: ACP phosphodiesterase [Clostridiales bacterium]|nr:ACP phosphodiesterase [Clostridiales bacterium]
MAKLLFIDGCVRPESRTRKLARLLLDQWQGEVEEVNLDQERLQPLNRDSLQLRNELIASHSFDAPLLRYAAQFKEADAVLIAAPYWDLSVPALVKAWLEAVTVDKMTFYYTPEGFPATLCKAKKLVFVCTAGGPIFSPNYGFDYVKSLAETFYNIPEVVCFQAQNLDIVGADVDAILAETAEAVRAYTL